MKTNPILRVRVFAYWSDGTVSFTRFSERTKNIHTRTYKRNPITVFSLKKFFLNLDRNHKGRFRHHPNGYSYLVWQGRTQNAS